MNESKTRSRKYNRTYTCPHMHTHNTHIHTYLLSKKNSEFALAVFQSKAICAVNDLSKEK